jgi:phosphoribosyl 1,2-cyclic phosphate phosphodiesterase
LGSGTSQGVPVIACSCTVCCSENPCDKRLRVACLVSDGETQIVIDVGTDFRQQMLQNKVQKLDAVLITHEHNDHTAGLDDLRSFNFRQGFDMPIFTSQQVLEDLKKRFAYTFEENLYPGAPRFEWNVISYKNIFKVKSLEVIPIKVMHGNLAILGFRIGDFAYLTDIKSLPQTEFDKLASLKVLVLSALHFQEHHAHFNIQEALAFVEKIKPEKTYLTHISHTMGLHDDVSLILPENVLLAYDGLTIQSS